MSDAWVPRSASGGAATGTPRPASGRVTTHGGKLVDVAPGTPLRVYSPPVHGAELHRRLRAHDEAEQSDTYFRCLRSYS